MNIIGDGTRGRGEHKEEKKNEEGMMESQKEGSRGAKGIPSREVDGRAWQAQEAVRRRPLNVGEEESVAIVGTMTMRTADQ